MEPLARQLAMMTHVSSITTLRWGRHSFPVHLKERAEEAITRLMLSLRKMILRKKSKRRTSRAISRRTTTKKKAVKKNPTTTSLATYVTSKTTLKSCMLTCPLVS
jgi:CO dehydrogenase/acetyl-CoA synthase alpha subunit